MSGKRCADELKAEAAKQVIEKGRSVRDVATRLGVSVHSLYAWVAKQPKVPSISQADGLLAVGDRRLQPEVRRMAQERDIVKKAAAYSAKG